MTRFAASLLSFSSALVLSAVALTPVAHAQSSASLRGRVLDASGRPGLNALVRLVSDTTISSEAHPRRYTLQGDALGKFSQEGIAPGAYLVMVFTDGKGTDILKHISLKPGEVAVLELTTGGQERTIEVATSSSSMPARRPTARQTR